MSANLLDIKRQSVEKVVGGLKDNSKSASHDAGAALLNAAREHQIPLRDYLILAVDTRTPGCTFAGLDGYQATLAYLNLPIKDDFKEGIVLQAASETFQTYPGTRALFPPVIDDMLYWTKRLDNKEALNPLLAGTITIAGNEMLYTIVNDDGSEYQTFVVPEMGRIPPRTIRTGEAAVKMWKHGSGIRTSYEFNRRSRLDLLTPFASRVQRELELSKIKSATTILINGDGSAGSAAPVVTQSSYNSQVTTAATVGQLAYQNVLAWMVDRASQGVAIDTVVGNWAAMFQWMKMFMPITGNGFSSPEQMIKEGSGVQLQIPQLGPQLVTFAISSAMPAGYLLGIVAGETLQQLVEAGGETAEEDRQVLNQTITYVRTEVSGFRLLWKDTRTMYNFAA